MELVKAVARIRSHREHLHRLWAQDVSFDARYYGGGSTTFDSAAGGLPLLSVVGSTMMSRFAHTTNSILQTPSLSVISMKEVEDMGRSLCC